MNEQYSILEHSEISTVSSQWSESASDKGEIFTKPNVVKFMLESAKLDDELLKADTRVLEPSFGHGEFLVGISELISQSARSGKKLPSAEELAQKVVAFELVKENFNETRAKIIHNLSQHYRNTEAELIADNWLNQSDFLLAEIEGEFSHIVGNPPYIRVENIPKPLLAEYRKRFSTMTDRADIYIAFFERCLDLLRNDGSLTFICTDRWTKNHYGRALRSYVSRSFNLDLYVDLYGHDSFESKVMTYPAITKISRSKQSKTVIAHEPSLKPELSRNIKKAFSSKPYDDKIISVRKDVVNSDAPWLFRSPDELNLVRKIEDNYKTIEEEGCKVYIGAATGNNKVYLVNKNLDIESDRKIPLVTSSDIRSGELSVSQKCIINTYDDTGIINLEKYPKLKIYLEKNQDQLKSRHVAHTSPKAWFKTIDRVYPERATKNKLLIPDIKSEFTVIYDDQGLHPNNSIYYICSDTWDLFALRAVLLSGIGKLFVETYSTKVANGHIRFQAQHLRRIRIPPWQSIDTSTQESLTVAGKSSDIETARILVQKIYGLTHKEAEIIGG